MIKKIHYYLLLTAFLCVQGMMAQSITVSGTVTDDLGSLLPGVNVVEKGTTNGTSTDFDGNYAITVSSSNATLVFTYIGFSAQEVPVAGQTTINLSMAEDAQQLGEVVVTALGIKRETKALGYSMTELKGEELAKTNTVNPVLGLQGKSSGVSIGSSDGGLFGNSKIQIRGVSTLNSGNNQPIFVIDGVILENSISNESADWSSDSNDYGNILKNLNPDDYKSVSVLKGAAATALYGSRGINGVVLIETKNGEGAKGLGVSIKQTVGVDHVYAQPGLQNEYGPGTLAGYIGYGEKDGNGEYYKYDTNQFYYNDQGQRTLINHPGGGLSYGPKFDGQPIMDYDGTMVPYSAVKNNMKDAYDTGYNTNTSVALSGGNEKGSFYLSDSYSKRSGILPNNTFNRNAMQLSGSYELSDWLKANASVSYTTSTSRNPRNDISQNFFQGGFERTYDSRKYRQEKYWLAPHGGVTNSNYGDEYAYAPNRSLWFSYEKNDRVREEQVVRPIVRLTAEVTDWMTVTAEGNMNQYTSKYEQKDLGTGFANDGGYYELQHFEDLSKTGKLSVNFNRQINEDLSAQLLVGGEIWNQEKSNTRVRTDGGLVVPGKFFLGNSKKTLLSEGGVYDTKQINSLYFMSSFGYKGQLYLDVTGRNDWSSALVYTDGTGNFSYFYPSVSTSWILSETFGTSDVLTFGKLRASWAQVGSDTNPYTINKGYGLSTYELEGGFAYRNGVNTTLVDKSIKPERKNSFEVGADFRFFGNRLGVDLAYYNETITEQIGSIPLPIESGYEALFTNIGTLSNAGIELSLTGTPVVTKDFEWNTTFNYWRNRTKVKELHEDFGDYKLLGGALNYGNFRVGSVAFEGGEYGVLMSDSAPKKYQATNAQGEPVDDPRNGMNVLRYVDSRRGAFYQRSGVVEKVGKIQPDFEGSLSNDFTYKGVSLSVLLDARFGGHMASYSSRYGTAYGYLERSLEGRSLEHGGITWESQYGDTNGATFQDGIIPDGVFEKGQMVTTPNGSSADVGGMTYQEAYDQGLVEPTHASYHHYFSNSWGQGVVNDDWFSEVKYIALRNVSLGYNLPKGVSDKIKAKSLYVGLNARNLGYLYNSMPNNINPESFRGTSSSDSYAERAFAPYMASYTMTIAIDF
ncbi:iron complex outermembrane recepter protein [Arenibacter nanhaiticus]|uniref:Iron complex outermembrane recepter protein n=1 Tax=Arenibacter nanhaiticus TaxID=558155 RepID=A0A1M6BM81_9FLAO|nr:SusC/RagA family TonB-linked outer membrane protein [Arenibacter nanhaiticus]SHI49658.1 iron complex outermembrane recepter protein [Arenibacter nanhaiticus]